MNLPFTLPNDADKNPIQKLMDYFEPSLIDQAGEPRYYGFLAVDGHFIIQKDATVGALESLKYFLGSPEDDFETCFTNRAALTYVFLHQLNFGTRR